ncbi:cupin domain-containing protein [Frigidibacter sp. MR17.24]|uniref:cupin domain-containing protein n=1 Tax=Frigidibacter sp. MR17.24 TaxID=3127345 RepID=UPI003012EB52
MQPIQIIDRSTLVPEVDRPEAERVLDGDPVHTTWLAEERDDFWSGMWQTTPGTWRVNFTEWEFIHVHSGLSILTDEDGVETRLSAGTSVIIRPGFKGTWTCIETTLKDFVIRA